MIVQILQNIDKAKSNRSILLGVLVLVGSLFNINITLANTGVNPQIPYSASIIKNDGTALSDGTYRAKFLLYNVASGGTAIYEEIRDGSTNYAGTGVSPLLSISDGRFEILLGSQNTTNFTSVLNDDSLWLELQLDMDNNGSYEEIFSPRRRLGSALYSINSMRLVANGGTSTNTLSLDSTGNLVFTGDSATERMRITGAGAITASALGGAVNASTPGGFDRLLLANSSGQFNQLSLGSLWSVFGNSTSSAWNGSAGSFLGTTSAQPLVLATTNATAQDIRFFTGANGANERMRITGGGALIIGNGDTSGTPAAGNLRGTDATGTNIAGNTFTLTGGRGTGTGVGGDLLFATAPAGSTGSTLNTANERMRITGAGNVGIGVINPLTRFDSRGTILVSTNINGNNILAFGNSASYGPLTGAPDGSHGSSFIVGNSTNDPGAASNLSFWTTVGGVVNERVRINSAGAVIIGNGDTSGTPAAGNLRGTDATGTNIAGNTFTLTGGRGTGTGVGGALLFATAPAGSTGATLNAAVTRLQITAAGNIGIGGAATTARLQLPAGTATANTAPLKFTSGTNLTTAEAGAMEWDGTNLFLTNSSNTRQTINQGLTATATLDFPSTANDSFSTLTVAVANAALNDVVSLGLPNGSVPAAATDFQAWVSVAGTVTVRFTNNSGVAQDPASGSFKVFVTKF